MSEEHGVEDEAPDPIPELKPFFSRAGGKIFIIWLAMTAVGVLIGIYAPHHLLPTMLSIQGTKVWQTIVLFTILAAPVAAFVYAVGLYSLIGWRARGFGNSDEPPPDGPSLRGDAPMTALWVGVSAALVIVLLVWGLGEFTAEQTLPSRHPPGQCHRPAVAVDVLLSGRRQRRDPITRPAGQPPGAVQRHLGGRDPRLLAGGAGRTGRCQSQHHHGHPGHPDKLGGFTVRCSQLCGLYHSFMYASGAVVTPQKFAVWLHGHGASASQGCPGGRREDSRHEWLAHGPSSLTRQGPASWGSGERVPT